MFDIDRFIADCQAAIPDGQPAIREVVGRTFADPAAVAAAMAADARGGLHTLHRSDTLTILNAVWPPGMALPPHNHRMFAVIGVYEGREDNIFWRRRGDTIEAAGAQSLGPGDVATLGRDIIHSVTNPLPVTTRAIHVYGGDFFSPPEPRSDWEHATLTERPWDIERSRAAFREADARARR